jgi:hypothetical protein
MYSSIDYINFDKHFIMLSGKTKNNIMENSDFYRVYYSDEFHNSNGLFLFFTLKNINLTKYFNKLKCSFDKRKNAHIIHSFTFIEREILQLCPNKKTKSVNRIGEQLENGFIKIFAETPHVSLGNSPSCNFLLKISGIWNNDKKHGLTFRFYIANRQLKNGE